MTIQSKQGNYLFIITIIIIIIIFVFSRATPVAYGRSPARGLIGAVAASLQKAQRLGL